MRLLPRIVLAAGLVLVVAALIHATLPQKSEASVAPPGASSVVVLTEHDNMTTRHIRQGQEVQVRFAQWNGMSWDSPQALKPLLTSQRSAVSSGQAGGWSWEFVASKTGTTDIVSSAAPVCKSGQPCPQILFSWRVKLVITS